MYFTCYVWSQRGLRFKDHFQFITVDVRLGDANLTTKIIQVYWDSQHQTSHQKQIAEYCIRREITSVGIRKHFLVPHLFISCCQYRLSQKAQFS